MTKHVMLHKMVPCVPVARAMLPATRPTYSNPSTPFQPYNTTVQQNASSTTMQNGHLTSYQYLQTVAFPLFVTFQ